MKILYLGGCLALTSLEAPFIGYKSAQAVERDRVEIVYLPNNTCYISAPASPPTENYKDLVRACLNNRHLRIKIDDHLPN